MHPRHALLDLTVLQRGEARPEPVLGHLDPRSPVHSHAESLLVHPDPEPSLFEGFGPNRGLLHPLLPAVQGPREEGVLGLLGPRQDHQQATGLQEGPQGIHRGLKILPGAEVVNYLLEEDALSSTGGRGCVGEQVGIGALKGGAVLSCSVNHSLAGLHQDHRSMAELLIEPGLQQSSKLPSPAADVKHSVSRFGLQVLAAALKLPMDQRS
mmetsp:Transcript_56500/g.121304  ORF Transcript_56500/g.121304 Transcript_56500/m.121304 type:complete len:210 (-) Transcript_56500:29-658(-)